MRRRGGFSIATGSARSCCACPTFPRLPADDWPPAKASISASAAGGALEVGADAGLPLHRFPLEQTAPAHAAVEGGAVGKVLIDVA
jgi:NADPH2:quinone reductase